MIFYIKSYISMAFEDRQSSRHTRQFLSLIMVIANLIFDFIVYYASDFILKIKLVKYLDTPCNYYMLFLFIINYK